MKWVKILLVMIGCFLLLVGTILFVEVSFFSSPQEKMENAIAKELGRKTVMPFQREGFIFEIQQPFQSIGIGLLCLALSAKLEMK